MKRGAWFAPATALAVPWLLAGSACTLGSGTKLPDTVIVDAHAHVFGASSLPIEGFLYQSLQVPRWVARLVDRALQWWGSGSRGLERPPTDAELEQAAQAILAELDSERGAVRFRADLAETGWISSADVVQADDDLRTVLRGVLASGEARARSAQDPELLRLIRQAESSPEWSSGPARGARATDTRDSTERSVLDSLDLVRRYLAWAELLTRSPETIGQRLLAQYPEVDLFLASTMDMRSWFDGRPPQISMEEQLTAATALIATSGGRILPLVAYDPWRDQGGTVLAWVKDAVATRGCVGVKLYPPLGYKPSGNDAGPWPTSTSPTATDWPDDAATWDAKLEALFAWCELEEVPIAVHCSNPGAEARPGRGLFSDPGHWAPVLAKHPNLRVNFAHFGGIDDYVRTRKTGWTWSVAQLMAAGSPSRVFADLGHTTEILPGFDPDYGNAFDELLAANEIVGERLLYGSDWHMVARMRGAADYLHGHAAFFAPRGERFLAQYLGGNALRWLGLDDKSGKAWGRLEPVLRAAGVDTVTWPSNR